VKSAATAVAPARWRCDPCSAANVTRQRRQQSSPPALTPAQGASPPLPSTAPSISRRPGCFPSTPPRPEPRTARSSYGTATPVTRSQAKPPQVARSVLPGRPTAAAPQSGAVPGAEPVPGEAVNGITHSARADRSPFEPPAAAGNYGFPGATPGAGHRRLLCRGPGHDCRSGAVAGDGLARWARARERVASTNGERTCRGLPRKDGTRNNTVSARERKHHG